MSKKKAEQLLKRLTKARREEDVKAAWARCFDLEIDTADDHDLYPEQVLFEFKLRQLRTARFKIATWDAGWWQVRSALMDREKAMPELAALKAKLLPQVTAMGFPP